MRTKLTSMVALGVIISCQAGDLSIQNPPASAADILKKSVEAQGGRDNLAGIYSVRMTGQIELPPIDEGGGPAPKVSVPSLSVTILVKRPNSVRMEIGAGSQVMVSIYDGAKAWSKDAASSSFHEMTQDGVGALMTALLKGLSETGRPLEFYAAQREPIELVGTERIGSRDAYKLKLIQGGRNSIYFFLDSMTFLKVKQSEIYQDLDLDTYYGDYRPVGRLVLPHYLEHRAVSNQTFSKINIQKFELNVEIDDSRFKLPSPSSGPPRAAAHKPGTLEW